MNTMINPRMSSGAGFVDVTEFGRPISGRNDAIERMARIFSQGISTGAIQLADGNTRRSDAIAVDAAEVFWTNTLEQMMASITRGPSTTTYMTGPDALLPIRTTLRPGQTALVYDIETPTGNASFVEPDGMRRLPQVGEFSERKRHETTWSGVGYGFGLIEGWQAAELGMSLDQSRAQTAQSTLQRFNEKVLLDGDIGENIPGMLANSNAWIVNLGAGFGALAPTQADEAMVLLQIMDHHFSRLAKSYGGMVTGVIAPKTDLYALQRMRYGVAGEGVAFLPLAMAAFPWLAQVVWIDGLEGRSPTGGNIWQMWSDDSNELWTELSPTPALYGPWTDGLRTSFALISHLGGVISRRPERMVRYQFSS